MKLAFSTNLISGIFTHSWPVVVLYVSVWLCERPNAFPSISMNPNVIIGCYKVYSTSKLIPISRIEFSLMYFHFSKLFSQWAIFFFFMRLEKFTQFDSWMFELLLIPVEFLMWTLFTFVTISKKMSTIFPSWLLCLSISLSTIFGCFVCRIRLYELHEWKHAIQFDVIVYVNRNGKRVIQHMHKHISRQRVDYDDGRNNDDDDNIKRGENINMNISISFSRLFKIFLLEKSHSHYRFHLDDWPWKTSEHVFTRAISIGV